MNLGPPTNSNPPITASATLFGTRKGYAIALSGVVAATVVRAVLTPWWGPTNAPFLLYLPAVLAIAWFVRLGPALFAVLLSTLVGTWFFMTGGEALFMRSTREIFLACSFALVTTAFAIVIEAVHRARDRGDWEHAKRRAREQEVAKQARLLNLSHEPILVRDHEDRITFWNSGAEATFGYSSADATGRMAHELLKPQYPESRARIMEALGRDRRWSGEISYTRADGGRVLVHSRWMSDHDAQGRLTAILETDHDITAAKQAELALRGSEERFRAMADNAPVLIWIAGPDKLRTWFNRRWLEFTGRALEQEAENGWLEGLHPEDRERCLQTYAQAFDRQEAFNVEFRVRRHDGVWRWLDDSGVATYGVDGAFTGYIGSCTDVTERKQVAEALQIARDEAVAANRAKDDFLATLSHELRTPLNPVLLVASEAVNDLSLPSRTRADFEMIARNVALEARLIDDLLDLNRIARGKIVLEHVLLDLHAILHETVATVAQEVTLKRIEVTYALNAPAACVSGDAARLRQVFWNIVGNAVKFTPVGGTITISSASVNDGAEIEIRVKDSGIGMTPDELKRVFEPFMQGRHVTQERAKVYGGLGLGLAIARTLVDLHDGQIRAESEGARKGCELIVRLPALAASAEIPPDRVDYRRVSTVVPLRPTSHQQTQRRILLVEDHEPTRHSLALLLERRGYAVSVAGSLAEARQQADGMGHDLLISDLGLPDGDGYELMAELRRKQPHLVGIAVSGYGMDTDVAQSLAAGFSEHLVKPIAMATLEKAVNRVLPTPSAHGENDLRL